MTPTRILTLLVSTALGLGFVAPVMAESTPSAPTEIEKRKEAQAAKDEVRIEELQSSKTKEIQEREDAEKATRDAINKAHQEVINNNTIDSK